MELQPPAICVSICEETIDALEKAIDKARPLANLIELRLDCLDPFQIGDNFSSLNHLLANSPIPIIVTYRPAEQGGRRALDLATRRMFWLCKRPPAPSLLDIEFDLARNSQAFAHGGQPDWSRVICSHHDLVGMPADLEQLYSDMAKTPAQILKIAVQANDAIDCLPIFNLLERARAEGRQMIAIAMGPAGIATRILGRARGGFITYAALDETASTASGQLTVSELTDLYHLERLNRETLVTGLIGNPVSHSLSAHLHNGACADAGVNAVYIPFLVREVEPFIRRMVSPRTREIDWNIRGLSVTSPHKVEVMRSLDWTEPAAAKIGAVNTIVVEGDQIFGYNTDGPAFLQTVQQNVGDLNGSRCAVLGAGGAASAVVWGMQEAGAELTVFARDKSKAQKLAEKFNVKSQSLSTAQFREFDIVVNATPLGTAGAHENQTPATTEQLQGTRLACDLVYNPLETRFLREARAAGCQTLGGLPMLVKQALEQFRLWTGIEASEHVMTNAATAALTSR